MEAAGIGEVPLDPDTGPEAKAVAIHRARKQSKSSALQNAFAKVILILIKGGAKVGVEIDTTKPDPFFYDPLWETHAVD